ncbi:hypothetical protein [Streptomyces pseudovenezuelae]|uniref:Uncharacterized protein n=1 Tax=Streptomyces pseudovenezuelae TaxID=67350 RepID=A0ABT6LZ25_9ACTN|nr:hypothetical protein [Streptomyces pseudovenezuelae]MDH6221488.1 hypothetical protein [Streptomyces pseudovenezuelae]
MTSTSPTNIVYDPAGPSRSGAALVTHQLDELRLGQHWVQTGEQDGLRIVDRRIPPRHGWCRATGLYRALWPATADLCVEVDWHADQNVPAAEQAEHWRTRLAAVTAGLESAGYTVRAPGPRRTPGVHRYQPLIVSRQRPGGAPPAACPTDGWDHLAVHPTYKWPERSPRDLLAATLEQVRLTNYTVRSLDTHLWPPYVTAAMVIMWRGASTAPVADWDSAIARVRRFLRTTGYGVMDHGLPWDPAFDDLPYVIAYLREGLRTGDRP